jgi:hypothetical protein
MVYLSPEKSILAFKNEEKFTAMYFCISLLCLVLFSSVLSSSLYSSSLPLCSFSLTLSFRNYHII